MTVIEPLGQVKVVNIEAAPYLTDHGMTRYYFGKELSLIDSPAEKEKFYKKVFRRTQKNIKIFEDETDGFYTRYFDGRTTNLLAFDAFGAYQSYCKLLKSHVSNIYSFEDYLTEKKIEITK